MRYRVLLKFLALTSFVTVGPVIAPLQAQPGALQSGADVSQFAGTYNGTYRTTGSRANESGTFALRIEPSGKASATQRSSSGVITVYFGAANLATGQFTLNTASTTNSTAGGISTVTGRLAIGFSTIGGTAKLVRPDRTTGTIRLSAPLATTNDGINPFADKYTGTSAVTTGPSTGLGTPATLTVNDDGSATGTLYGPEGSLYYLSGAANSVGLFNLRNRAGGRATVTASGRLGANGASGTYAIVSGPIVVRGTLTLTRRPAPVVNPFAGNYNGNLQITAGPGAGTAATLAMRVDSDGSAMATSRDAAGNSLTFTGTIGANGVIGLRGVINGTTYGLTGRLLNNGTNIGGNATYSSTAGGRGSATLRQTATTGTETATGGTTTTPNTTAPATITGDYSGRYSIPLDDGGTATGTIGLHIAANGIATGVARDPDGTVMIFNGNANLTTGNFSLRAIGNLPATFSGRITTDTGLSLGSGNLVFAAGDRNAVVLTQVPAQTGSPFVGSYTGSYRTTEGPDEGETGEFTLRVSSDGQATATAISDDDLEDAYLMGDGMDDENADDGNGDDVNDDLGVKFTGTVNLETGTFKLLLNDDGQAATVVGRLRVDAANPPTVTGRGNYADSDNNIGAITLTKD